MKRNEYYQMQHITRYLIREWQRNIDLSIIGMISRIFWIERLVIVLRKRIKCTG